MEIYARRGVQLFVLIMNKYALQTRRIPLGVRIKKHAVTRQQTTTETFVHTIRFVLRFATKPKFCAKQVSMTWDAKLQMYVLGRKETLLVIFVHFIAQEFAQTIKYHVQDTKWTSLDVKAKQPVITEQKIMMEIFARRFPIVPRFACQMKFGAQEV